MRSTNTHVTRTLRYLYAAVQISFCCYTVYIRIINPEVEHEKCPSTDKSPKKQVFLLNDRVREATATIDMFYAVRETQTALSIESSEHTDAAGQNAFHISLNRMWSRNV